MAMICYKKTAVLLDVTAFKAKLLQNLHFLSKVYVYKSMNEDYFWMTAEVAALLVLICLNQFFSVIFL